MELSNFGNALQTRGRKAFQQPPQNSHRTCFFYGAADQPCNSGVFNPPALSSADLQHFLHFDILLPSCPLHLTNSLWTFHPVFLVFPSAAPNFLSSSIDPPTAVFSKWYFWLALHFLVYSLTYLLTPHSTVLLQKLTGSQLVKKFPTFYGTRRFITAFTSARNLSLSWDRPIQSIPLCLNSWRSLYYTPIYAWIFQVVSFPQVSHQNPLYTSPLPHTCYMPRPSHSSRFYHPNNIGEQYRSLSSSICSFLPSPVILSPSCLNGKILCQYLNSLHGWIGKHCPATPCSF